MLPRLCSDCERAGSRRRHQPVTLGAELLLVLENVGLRARRSQSHRDATIARTAAHNPSTSRIESEEQEAALKQSYLAVYRVEKKVHHTVSLSTG